MLLLLPGSLLGFVDFEFYIEELYIKFVGKKQNTLRVEREALGGSG